MSLDVDKDKQLDINDDNKTVTIGHFDVLVKVDLPASSIYTFTEIDSY